VYVGYLLLSEQKLWSRCNLLCQRVFVAVIDGLSALLDVSHDGGTRGGAQLSPFKGPNEIFSHNISCLLSQVKVFNKPPAYKNKQTSFGAFQGLMSPGLTGAFYQRSFGL
jgi:hypothetical protein